MLCENSPFQAVYFYIAVDMKRLSFLTLGRKCSYSIEPHSQRASDLKESNFLLSLIFHLTVSQLEEKEALPKMNAPQGRKTKKKHKEKN